MSRMSSIRSVSSGVNCERKTERMLFERKGTDVPMFRRLQIRMGMKLPSSRDRCLLSMC